MSHPGSWWRKWPLERFAGFCLKHWTTCITAWPLDLKLRAESFKSFCYKQFWCKHWSFYFQVVRILRLFKVKSFRNSGKYWFWTLILLWLPTFPHGGMFYYCCGDSNHFSSRIDSREWAACDFKNRSCLARFRREGARTEPKSYRNGD